MELTIKQAEAIQNKSRYKVLNWGRRSGKTTEFAYEALVTALNIPNAKITYYAQTLGDARDIAWDIFLDVFGKAVIKKNETLLEITVRNLKQGTSKVTLKGWESVVTGARGRGTENNLILCDEVAFCRGFLSLWETVLEPTLLTSKGRAVFASTPNGFNDFYIFSNKAQNQRDWFYSHATSYDNPHNDTVFLDEKKETLPEDVFVQEYMADFRRQQGLVFKEFVRSIHVYKDKQIDEDAFLGGVDFGFTNPAAITSVKRDKRGIYWVFDEYYERGKTDAQVAEVVAAKEFNKVYPDPENAGAIKELKDRRVNVCEVLKGPGSIKAGIDKMRELFKQGRLKIHVSCINLIWELETYHYPKKVLEGNEKEVPVKENDHLIDSLRYLILMDAKNKEIRVYNKWIQAVANGNVRQNVV